MSRFGEPKPVERIKVLPQKTIKKVASKQDIPRAKLLSSFGAKPLRTMIRYPFSMMNHIFVSMIRVRRC